MSGLLSSVTRWSSASSDHCRVGHTPPRRRLVGRGFCPEPILISITYLEVHKQSPKLQRYWRRSRAGPDRDGPEIDCEPLHHLPPLSSSSKILCRARSCSSRRHCGRIRKWMKLQSKNWRMHPWLACPEHFLIKKHNVVWAFGRNTCSGTFRKNCQNLKVRLLTFAPQPRSTAKQPPKSKAKPGQNDIDHWYRLLKIREDRIGQQGHHDWHNLNMGGLYCV